jgi:hypothetical protein
MGIGMGRMGECHDGLGGGRRPLRLRLGGTQAEPHSSLLRTHKTPTGRRSARAITAPSWIRPRAS